MITPSLAILHCSNYCHVESRHPHQKYITTTIMCVCYRKLGSLIYFWWRWWESHPRPQQLSNNFCELLQYKKHCNYTQCKSTGTGVKCKTFYFNLSYTFFARHYRILSSNQITKIKLRPPAKNFKAPYCLSFCSGVQSFCQYLFIVSYYKCLYLYRQAICSLLPQEVPSYHLFYIMK